MPKSKVKYKEGGCKCTRGFQQRTANTNDNLYQKNYHLEERSAAAEKRTKTKRKVIINEQLSTVLATLLHANKLKLEKVVKV